MTVSSEGSPFKNDHRQFFSGARLKHQSRRNIIVVNLRQSSLRELGVDPFNT